MLDRENRILAPRMTDSNKLHSPDLSTNGVGQAINEIPEIPVRLLIVSQRSRFRDCSSLPSGFFSILFNNLSKIAEIEIHQATHLL